MPFGTNKAQRAIIWDLGNTLIEPNFFKVLQLYLKMINSLGIKIFALSIYEYYQNPLDIQQIFHNSLKMPQSCLYEPMKSFLTNKGEMQELHKQTLACLDKSSEINDYQKILLKNTVNLLFNPKELAWSMSVIKPGLKLLKACYEKEDKQGNRLNDLFILSNWDLESFKCLYQSRKTKELFDCIKKENLFISGRTGYLKPFKNAYENLLNKSNLNPRNCIFIDDEIANIETAKELGMNAIQIMPGKYNLLAKELKLLEVI